MTTKAIDRAGRSEGFDGGRLRSQLYLIWSRIDDLLEHYQAGTYDYDDVISRLGMINHDLEETAGGIPGPSLRRDE